jgi:16S rRNA (cytosine967-C5)-methyltransferase
MQNKGFIMAQDLDVRRRLLIRENCDRLGVRGVSISRATTTVNPQLSEPFDKILVDAPCTNTGVLRRRLDLRWRLQPADLRRLPPIQLELLHRSAEQLRPGGPLVYSTCSLEPEENRGVIEAFLHKHPGFTLEQERELLPFNAQCDGAYVAVLRRSIPSSVRS